MTQPPADLTAVVFRALYTGYDLHTHDGLHVVTPKGTPVFISASLGQIARHLSTPGPCPPSSPDRRSPPGYGLTLIYTAAWQLIAVISVRTGPDHLDQRPPPWVTHDD